MRESQAIAFSSESTIRACLLETIDRLLISLRAEQTWLKALEQVFDLLRSLPLTSGEFGVGINRIDNARRYVRAGEYGAARYEVQLLSGIVRERVSSIERLEPKMKVPNQHIV